MLDDDAAIGDVDVVGGASALTVYGRSCDVSTATAGLQGRAVLSRPSSTATPIIAHGLIGYLGGGEGPVAVVDRLEFAAVDGDDRPSLSSASGSNTSNA